MNDTYSFGGSSGRAVACPVTGYALYSPPTKRKRTALPPGEPDRTFPGRFPGVVKSGLEVSE